MFHTDYFTWFALIKLCYDYWSFSYPSKQVPGNRLPTPSPLPSHHDGCSHNTEAYRLHFLRVYIHVENTETLKFCVYVVLGPGVKGGGCFTETYVLYIYSNLSILIKYVKVMNLRTLYKALKGSTVILCTVHTFSKIHTYRIVTVMDLPSDVLRYNIIRSKSRRRRNEKNCE